MIRSIGIVSTSLIICSLATAAMAQKYAARGRVSMVEGKTITIQLEKGGQSLIGDEVRVFVEIPGIGRAEIATARVTKVSDDRIVALIEKTASRVKTGQDIMLSRAASQPPKPAEPPTGASAPAGRGAKSPVNTNEPVEPSSTLGLGLMRFDDQTLVVIGMLPNGASAEAGLQRFDIIVSIDGKRSFDSDEVRKFLVDYQPGDEVLVEYKRSDQVEVVAVTLAPRPPVWDKKKMLAAAKSGDAWWQYQYGLTLCEEGNAEGARWLQAAADLGSTRALWALGEQYRQGQGVPRDYAASAKQYEKAMAGTAEPRDSRAIDGSTYQLGVLYLNGHGVEQDDAKAEELFHRAAWRNHRGAQTLKGWMLEAYRGTVEQRGITIEEAQRDAVKWYRKAVEADYNEAKYLLGMAYRRGIGGDIDDKESVRWLRAAAGGGLPDAQAELGWMYSKGRGVEQDSAAAIKLYRLSADAGSGQGQAYLGGSYFKEQGVEQSDQEALKWNRMSAEKGTALGQYHMGVHYSLGRGVPQSYAKALPWLRKSAEQSNERAESYLGVCYLQGLGVKQDYGKALEWFRRSAEHGSATGRHNLGVMFENGWGVARNKDEAIQWYYAAAGQGYDSSIQALARHGIYVNVKP